MPVPCAAVSSAVPGRGTATNVFVQCECATKKVGAIIDRPIATVLPAAVGRADALSVSAIIHY